MAVYFSAKFLLFIFLITTASCEDFLLGGVGLS